MKERKNEEQKSEEQKNKERRAKERRVKEQRAKEQKRERAQERANSQPWRIFFFKAINMMFFILIGQFQVLFGRDKG